MMKPPMPCSELDCFMWPALRILPREHAEGGRNPSLSLGHDKRRPPKIETNGMLFALFAFCCIFPCFLHWLVCFTIAHSVPK